MLIHIVYTLLFPGSEGKGPLKVLPQMKVWAGADLHSSQASQPSFKVPLYAYECFILPCAEACIFIYLHRHIFLRCHNNIKCGYESSSQMLKFKMRL